MQEMVPNERFNQRLREIKGLISAGFFSEDDIVGKNVLDWECGDGAFALAFRELGAKSVVGIDSWVNFSEEYVHQAKKRGVTLATKSISDIGDEEFDLVFCNTVTEHIQSLHESISAVSSVLGLGGVFFTNHDNYYHPAGSHDHGFVKVKGKGDVVFLAEDCWDQEEKCAASNEHRVRLSKNRPFQWGERFERMLNPVDCTKCPYFIRAQPWAHIAYQKDFSRVFPKTMRIGGSLNKLTPFQLRQILSECGLRIEREARTEVSLAPSATILQADPSLSEALLRTWMVKLSSRKVKV